MIFNISKQVRFHHCDPAGIVFYPQFFYLLHEVQEDFLSHVGFPEHKLIQSGFGLPVVDLKTEFLGMCRHGDDLDISLCLTKIGNLQLWLLENSLGLLSLPQILLPARRGLALKFSFRSWKYRLIA